MRILITGGAGFIGCNLALDAIRAGHDVTVLDNLSRRGAADNLTWLREASAPAAFEFVRADVRDAAAMREATSRAEAIYHLAAQTAVTTSVVEPRYDFEANAGGAFNVLEGARASGADPIVIYSSTNKVYGGLEDLRVMEGPTRYSLPDLPLGVPETQPLDFHSPYGCSKGAADQYVRDYARIYGLRTVVFRQSCIYGRRQMGIEDQGWVAWFAIAAVTGKPITIFGDGKQVRDVLEVDDLVRAFRMATEQIAVTKGQVYNIGGGPANTLAIWTEFGPILSELVGREIIPAAYRPTRPGDQPIFVADVAKAAREFGWRPQIGVKDGITRLVDWVSANLPLFA
jgi:CDP-paratose 2-epimerase